MTCSSHDDNTGKMTMNRRRRQKRKQEGAGRNLGASLMARRRGLTRGIGRLWKGCGKRATWGYKPLSRTITIHAINLSLGPVTRIMRAVRVSASITFEIPYGLGLTILLSPPPPSSTSSSSLSRTLYFFSSASSNLRSRSLLVSTISFRRGTRRKIYVFSTNFFFSRPLLLMDFDLFSK